MEAGSEPYQCRCQIPHGYGLYAHDGGVIRLGKATVSSGLVDAVYAERGGRITFATDSYTGNLKTDGDENSHIRTTILKSMRGDALGHVGMKLGAKASWEGSASSLTDLTLGNDSVWHVGRAGDIRLPVLSGSNGNIHMNRAAAICLSEAWKGKQAFLLKGMQPMRPASWEARSLSIRRRPVPLSRYSPTVPVWNLLKKR